MDMVTMARTTKVLSFSVTPEIAETFEGVAESERRSKSELFREMFRVYQQYRTKRTDFDDQWVTTLIREAKENPITTEESLAESRKLAAYGARRAKETGADALTDDDIQNVIYEHRAEPRTVEKSQ